jgi:LAO/AO transport system kinase
MLKPVINCSLHIIEGSSPDDKTGKEAVEKFTQKRKKEYRVNEYAQGILEGDRNLLGQTITLLESTIQEHQKKAEDIIEICYPHTGKSIRIGITGIPGVGKSTFIEALGKELIQQGHKLAILAIDPSSTKSKGSILGDKTRMEDLSSNSNVFIRPSPTSGVLGGVAKKTRESILLCEAAGFDIIIVETVGVGQSEIDVHSMVDFFLLLLLPGAGDELQGIKRGIVEMADGIAVTKADGANISRAEQTKSAYENALHLFPATDSGWITRVSFCSSITNSGIYEIWNGITEFTAFHKQKGFFDKRRSEQNSYWMYQAIENALKSKFFSNQELEQDLKNYENEVQQNKLSSFKAAKDLLEKYFKQS